MKKLIVLFMIIMAQIPSGLLACTVCNSKQPRALQGLTHSAGPDGSWDYIIVIGASIFVLITLAMSLRYLIKPNEDNTDHVKNMILNEFHK